MRTVRVLAMVLVFAGLVGCGDDRFDSTTPTPTPTPPTPVVTAGTFALRTVESTLITIAGTDLTAFGGAAPQVRLTASAGTPFAGGTSAGIDLPGTVASDTSLTAMSPLAAASADFTATVTVVHASGNQAAGTVTFSVPTISGFTPPTLERGVAATLDVAGAGFASATGVVDVVLTAQGGATPFAGGTDTLHVIAGATVASDTQITAGVTIPDIVGVATATITVEFPGGTSIEAPGTIGVEGVILVTNLNDSGAGSLRAALAAAGSGGSVEFDAALTGTIALASQLEITDDVTIAGPGAAVIQVSGGNAARVLHVAAGVTARVEGLTLQDGLAENGAAVLATGADLTFSGCAFNGNEGGVIVDVVAGDTHGDVAARGGVLAMDTGSLSLLACTSSNNVLAVDLTVRSIGFVVGTAGNVEVLGGLFSCGNADVTVDALASTSDEARVTILGEPNTVIGNVTTKGAYLYSGSGSLTLTNLQSDAFLHAVTITLDEGATIGNLATWGGLACSETGDVVVDGGSRLDNGMSDQDCDMALDATVGDIELRGGMVYAGTGALTLDDVDVGSFDADIGVTSPLIPGVTRQTVGNVTALGAAFFAGSGAVALTNGRTDTDLDVSIDLGDGSSLGDVRCEGGTLYAGTGTLAVTNWDFDDGNIENIDVTATASSLGGVAVAGAGAWTAAASPAFVNCLFDQCDFDINVILTTCFADDVTGRGVGVFCDATVTALTLTDCRFQDQDLEIAVTLDFGCLIGSVIGEGGDVYGGTADVTMTDCVSDNVEIDLDVSLSTASLAEDVMTMGGCLRSDGGSLTASDCAITDPLITPTLTASDGSVVTSFLVYGGGLSQLAGTGSPGPILDLDSVELSGLAGNVDFTVDSGAVVGLVVVMGGQLLTASDTAALVDCTFADNTMDVDGLLEGGAEIGSFIAYGVDMVMAPTGDATVDECTFDRALLDVNLTADTGSETGRVIVAGGSIYAFINDSFRTTFRDCTGSGATLRTNVLYADNAQLGGTAEVRGGVLFASTSGSGTTRLESCSFTEAVFEYTFEANGDGPVEYDTVAGGGCLAHDGSGSLVATACILNVARFALDGALVEVAPGGGLAGDWRIGGGALLNEGTGTLGCGSCILSIDDWDVTRSFTVQTLLDCTGTVCGTIGYAPSGAIILSGSSQVVGALSAFQSIAGPGLVVNIPTLDFSNICP